MSAAVVAPEDNVANDGNAVFVFVCVSAEAAVDGTGGVSNAGVPLSGLPPIPEATSCVHVASFARCNAASAAADSGIPSCDSVGTVADTANAGSGAADVDGADDADDADDGSVDASVAAAVAVNNNGAVSPRAAAVGVLWLLVDNGRFCCCLILPIAVLNSEPGGCLPAIPDCRYHCY